MTQPTQSVVVERELAFAHQRVWRALTQPELIAEWLMKSDFKLEPHHAFKLDAGWGKIECKVLEIETEKTLSYTWEAAGLKSVVTWTLTPTEAGTTLRMEQTGFDPETQKRALHGAKNGWPKFFEQLETLLAKSGQAKKEEK